MSFIVKVDAGDLSFPDVKTKAMGHGHFILKDFSRASAFRLNVSSFITLFYVMLSENPAVLTISFSKHNIMIIIDIVTLMLRSLQTSCSPDC